MQIQQKEVVKHPRKRDRKYTVKYMSGNEVKESPFDSLVLARKLAILKFRSKTFISLTNKNGIDLSL